MIDNLIEASAVSHSTNLVNALAVALEQSDTRIISSAELETCASRLSDAPWHLHYRTLSDQTKVWTLGFDWEVPLIVQVYCMADEYTGQKLSLVVSLILHANAQLIGEVVKQFGGNKEGAFVLNICTEGEFRKNVDSSFMGRRNHPGIASSTTESNVPWGEEQPPTLLIVHDDYESLADIALNPDSHAFVWLLMNLHRALVVHCTHQDRKDTKRLARKAREFCEAILS
jgi:hypothetical protein